MTNEEKINLRERALRLANEILDLPFPCFESLKKEADAIYQFLSKDLDDDPLKLGAPSPDYNEKIERWAKAVDEEIKKQRTEIDWDRPQLLMEIDGGRIAMTNGKHQGDWFEANAKYPGIGHDTGDYLNYSSYQKRFFKYHGEIPQEPKAEDKIILQSERNVKVGNLSIADAVRHASIFKGNLLIAREGDQYDFDVLKINHRTGEIECIGSEQWFASMPSARAIAAQDWQVFTLDEKIPEEPRMESKTTGLNFLEATLIAKNSRARIGRLSYKVPLYFELSQSGDFLTCTGSGYAHSLSIEDILATDWQIIEP